MGRSFALYICMYILIHGHTNFIEVLEWLMHVCGDEIGKMLV